MKFKKLGILGAAVLGSFAVAGMAQAETFVTIGTAHQALGGGFRPLK